MFPEDIDGFYFPNRRQQDSRNDTVTLWQKDNTQHRVCLYNPFKVSGTEPAPGTYQARQRHLLSLLKFKEWFVSY